MSRSTSFQNPQKQVIQTLEDQHKYDLPTFRRLDVNASQVNQEITPFVATPEQSGALKLASSLDIKAPLFEKFLNEKIDERNTEETLRGQKAAEQGNPSDVTSLAFYNGYMKTQGYLGSMKDKERMNEEWLAAPKDTGVTFSQWSQDWWKKNTTGLQDPAYLSGYMPQMTQAFHDTQSKDAEAHVKSLMDSRDGSVREVFTNTLRESSKAGGLDMATYESVRQVALNMGMNPAEANAQYVAALEGIAKAPTSAEDVAAVKAGTELLKQKHTDGTPGFAKWGEAAANALNAEAVSRHLSLLNTVEAEHDKQREVAREDKMFEITKKMIDDPDGAMADLKGLMADPNSSQYFDSKSMLQIFNTYRSSAQKVENEGQKLEAAKMLSLAYQGKLTWKQATDAADAEKIGGSGLTQVISGINAYQSQQRQLAASGIKAEASYTKHPEYKQGAMILESLPRGVPSALSALDMDGSMSSAIKWQYENSRALYDQFAMTHPKEDLADYADQLHRNAINYVKNIQTNHAFEVASYAPKYDSLSTLKAAVASGKETNETLVRRELAYYASKVNK